MPFKWIKYEVCFKVFALLYMHFMCSILVYEKLEAVKHVIKTALIGRNPSSPLTKYINSSGFSAIIASSRLKTTFKKP